MSPSVRTEEVRRKAGGPFRGFSLTEVVIALGIVSFALIAIVGIIPLGFSSLKDSVSDTNVSLLLTNVRAALEGQAFKAGGLDGMFFDASGQFQGTSALSNSYYQVDVSLAPPAQNPSHARVLVATVRVGWPADIPADKRRTHTTSFLVTPLTGNGWAALDPAFQPRIGL